MPVKQAGPARRRGPAAADPSGDAERPHRIIAQAKANITTPMQIRPIAPTRAMPSGSLNA
jgi:hypothetical protein